jgi:hypothetical protein
MNTEKNIIIAKFIGMQETDLGWFDAEEVLKLPNNKDNTFDELMFDKDWNWLISVVGFIRLNDVMIFEDELSYEITDSVLDNDLTRGFGAVLNYIKKLKKTMETLKIKQEKILTYYDKLKTFIKEYFKELCIENNNVYILTNIIYIDYIDAETLDTFSDELRTIELINEQLKFRLISADMEEIVLDFDVIRTDSLISIVDSIK